MIAFGGAVAPTGWLVCNGAIVSRDVYSGLFAVVGIAYGAGNGTTTFALPDLGGRVPMGISGTAHPRGQEGGEENTALSIANLATHGHGGVTGADPGHNHGGGGTSSAGSEATGSSGGDLTSSDGGGNTGERLHAGTGYSSQPTGAYDATVYGLTSNTGYQNRVMVWTNAFDATHNHYVAPHNHSQPTHTHSQPAHAHTIANQAPHTHGVTSQGSGTPHNNLQPYRVVNYIIKF